MNNLSEAIRKARVKAGLTQKELAEKLGFKTKAAIAQVEAGRRSLSTLHLVKTAEILKTKFIIDEKSLNEINANDKEEKPSVKKGA